ncbi:Uncharacterised protein [Burkholderia pseudomallei]|nr:Uncharacterised protein [Burkholderia pseudomallei]VCC57614.1 Uncharacterised protein [Burkholderia pseudomallei]
MFVTKPKSGSSLFSARLPGFPAAIFRAVGLGFLPRPGTVAIPPTGQLLNF